MPLHKMQRLAAMPAPDLIHPVGVIRKHGRRPGSRSSRSYRDAMLGPRGLLPHPRAFLVSRERHA
ncbi:MAG: hypothetical protein MZU91_07210 [Desulfosudis oleivorans]|nr:hypothetical protein [Desulfosudis oleivorans]